MHQPPLMLSDCRPSDKTASVEVLVRVTVPMVVSEPV